LDGGAFVPAGESKHERIRMSEAEEANQQEELEVLDDDLSKGPMLVGVGASAGGLDALRQFFERLPADSGLTFVVILHLSPEHESVLAELLQSRTKMTVTKVTEAVRVEPNHVYVIPPDRNLVMSDGYIRLTMRERDSLKHVPVDLFFRTLAEHYRQRAIAVVLSGSGTDGSLGVRNIKEAGGIAIAQDPLEAEYDGMPRSAIESGAVDFILPVREIPEKLIALRQNAERIQLPAPRTPSRSEDEEALDAAATHRAAAAGDRVQRHPRLPRIRPRPPGRTQRPAARPADQRHQLLP